MSIEPSSTSPELVLQKKSLIEISAVVLDSDDI